MLICGGGQTPDMAIDLVTKRIERIGVDDFRRQVKSKTLGGAVARGAGVEDGTTSNDATEHK